MPNIAITTKCNLKCPYCFAEDYTDNCVSEEMSYEDFLKAKKFILNSGIRSFGIIGGEPSIHSRYRDILRNCISDTNVERIVIYTNGLNVENFLGEYVSSKVHFLINCNSPKNLGNNFEKLQANLDLLANKFCAGNRITLGLNLYEVEQDYSYIIGLCKRINANSIRLSVTVPMKKCNMKKYFMGMKNTLISCYRDLMKEKIRPHYDCNVIPGCCYSEKELFEIATLLSGCGAERERLIGEKCVCKPVIDILPNLNAIRCFGLSQAGEVPISEFRNITDLRNYFLRTIDSKLVDVKTNTECDGCYKRKTLQCYGGCLAFRYNQKEE